MLKSTDNDNVANDIEEKIPGLPAVNADVPMPPVKPPRKEDVDCWLKIIPTFVKGLRETTVIRVQPSVVPTSEQILAIHVCFGIHSQYYPGNVFHITALSVGNTQELLEDSLMQQMPTIGDCLRDILGEQTTFEVTAAGIIPTPKEIKIDVPNVDDTLKDRIIIKFPDMVYHGDGVFTSPIIGLTEEQVQWKLNAISEGIASLNVVVQGIQPENPWPRTSALNGMLNNKRFLTERGRLDAPPYPGSPELERQSKLRGALQQQAGVDVDAAILMLSQQVETMNPSDDIDLKNDPAIVALSALKRVKDDTRKAVIHRRIRLFLGFLILAGVVVGAYFLAIANLATGRYNVVSECAVPYGADQLTAERTYSYAYKSLLGFVWHDTNAIETTKLKLPGDGLTILGIDSKTKKTWRMDYAKGEFGTAVLKQSDLYWFVGEKGKTGAVYYNSFCN